MRNALLVLNSNQINRKNMIFPIPTLLSALRQSWKNGVPTCISHDMHRPIAYTKGLSLYLESGLARLTGILLMPENSEDSDIITRMHLNHLVEHNHEAAAPYLAEFIELLDGNFDKTKDYSLLFNESPALCQVDLAKRTFSDIFKHCDKYFLVPLKLLQPISPGVYRHGKLLMFAHPYFRRSLSRLNSLNVEFLHKLQEVTTSSDNEVKVALDPDMVGLAEHFHESIELEYWRGPRYNDDLNSIPLGISHHEADSTSKFYCGLIRTEFFWYTQKEEKIFECEELQDLGSFGIAKDKFGCRYVHSIISSSGSAPFHLDGAIRMYDEEKMIHRLDSDLKRAPRDTDYTKLWRVDGSINVSTWKELIGDYYKDNKLLWEYFQGVEDELTSRPEIVEPIAEADPLRKYVPSNMEASDGIKMSIYFKDKEGFPSEGRLICSERALESGNLSINYYESETLEIIKMLKMRGLKFGLDKTLTRLAFEDTVVNLPNFIHLGESAWKDASITLSCIIDYCDIRLRKNHDVLVSFALGVDIGSTLCMVSYAGHVGSFVKLMGTRVLALPDGSDELDQWCDIAYSILCENFKQSIDNPPMSKMLSLNGELHFNRIFIDPNRIKVIRKPKSNASDIAIKMNVNDKHLANTRGLYHEPVIRIIKSRCSRCGGDYKLCNCMKSVGSDVMEIIEKGENLAHFWTVRQGMKRDIEIL